MATHNGERFLADQLASIAMQSHRDWRLLISDDASTDGSQTIIGDFIRTRPEGQVTLLQGPRKGATENFRSMLRRVDLGSVYLAFSDQDDVWEKDHLSRAIGILSGLHNPLAVYGCRMQICDKTLRPIGLSDPATAPLGFRNALVQNMLSGNTMVMTSDAAHLLQKSERQIGPVPVHDWWAYQIITGAGGTAVLDLVPSVLYRQHDNNVIGHKQGRRALITRSRGHLAGRYRTWARQNIAALKVCAPLLTQENRHCLDAFSKALMAPLPQKVAELRRSGIYYQKRRDYLAFWLLVALGRF